MKYFLGEYKVQLKVEINLENCKIVRMYMQAEFDMYILYIIVNKNVYKYYINIFLYFSFTDAGFRRN